MFRSLDRWLLGYVTSALRRPRVGSQPRHLLFCVADHFEPFRGNSSPDQAGEIVGRWVDEYPRLWGDLHDADGKCPQHTFFYPREEYDGSCLDRLAEVCSKGYGEVEVHLHHRHDTAEGLRCKLGEFRDTLRQKHGLLGHDAQGRTRFGFVHGNWALCNSRPDRDWCGVNEEIAVLRDAGCYADFTFPSAPSPTQPRAVNVIYRAMDNPGQPGGCDRGKEVRVSNDRSLSSVSGLVLITGPLALDWRRRKWSVLPRVENGAITAANPPTERRTDLWVRQQIHVRERPEWVFVKIYTHGCVPENMSVLLGKDIRRMHDHLKAKFNDGKRWSLHYVTAREMYNIVRAAEDGYKGNPREYRDYEILPPARKMSG